MSGWTRAEIGSATEHLEYDPKRTFQGFMQELVLFAKRRPEFESDLPIPDVQPGGHRPAVATPSRTSREAMQKLREWVLDARFDRNRALAFLEALKKAPDDAVGARLKKYMVSADRKEWRLNCPTAANGDFEFWTYDFVTEQRKTLCEAWSFVQRMLGAAKVSLMNAKRSPGVDRTLAKYFFLNRGGMPGERTANEQLDQVMSKFEFVIASVNGRPSSIVCSNVKTTIDSPREAAARKNSPQPDGNEMYIYPTFFSTEKKIHPNHLAPYRAAVIIHELTHMFCGTHDVRDAYGWESCGNLKGEEQRNNADNYALFAFEATYSMFGGGGTRLSHYVEELVAAKAQARGWKFEG